MRIFPTDKATQARWKRNPAILAAGSRCWRCRIDMVVTQSMRGGWVTRTCPRCKSSSNLSEAAFRELAVQLSCPTCNQATLPDILPDKNYGYVCASCDVGVPLFALIPNWDDDLEIASTRVIN